MIVPRRAIRLFRVAALTGAALCGSGRAFCDPATAEALFRQGRQLMSEGKTSDACEKFAASQRMDASSGTLLYLADCDAKSGKTASAWAEFLSAARMARNQGDVGRADEATKRARELEPKLSHIT